MTSSELRYLIAADELAKAGVVVTQTNIAGKLGVTKVSAYNAVERLKEKGLIEKSERKITLTGEGEEALGEYLTIIRFISGHLAAHCGTPKNQAYDDALNATCAFSDATRNGVAKFIRSELAGGSFVRREKEQTNDR